MTAPTTAVKKYTTTKKDRVTNSSGATAIDTNAADFDASTQGLLELVRAHFPNGGSEKESAPAAADKKPAKKKR